MKKYVFIFFIGACNITFANDTTHTKPLMATTTGKLPFLLYGLGEDRLGGAKAGFIDTNIVLKVIDTSNYLCKVQVSKYHSFYIEKMYLKFDSAIRIKPFYLSTNIKAIGTDSCYDKVTINLDEKLPYTSTMETNPSTIKILIYGVHSNTNWITQLSTLQEIKNVYYKQIEDDVLQIIIELKHKQHWGYSIAYAGKQMVIKIKQQPQLLSIKNLKIAIDAGHGGTNIGAGCIYSKMAEKTLTLLYATEFKNYLEKMGVQNIVSTRTIDTTFDMKDRLVFLQKENPDVLISFHFNSHANKEINGVSTYYKHLAFRPLSQAVLKRMTELELEDFGNVGNFNFGLNGPTEYINCLLEVAFLSNEDDEKKVLDPNFKTLVAKQVAIAITDWLQQIKQEQ
jgi:N-acetylmuramoyl-L-alanine amidase